jgi:rSAM/selenodomain-associated transferase 1
MHALPALIVFARAPTPGKAKTRLIPALGEQQTAELYRCFLLDTLERMSPVDASLRVAVADETDVDAVRGLASQVCPHCEVITQVGGDLGQRMEHSLRQVLDGGHPAAVIIGADSPSLPLPRIGDALHLASQADLVLGPCIDGGYYLIGLPAVVPSLFRGISWGSPTVLLDTLQIAKEGGQSVALLEPWYDVDTPHDLALLCTHLTALSLAGADIPCPRTWAYIQDLSRKR